MDIIFSKHPAVGIASNTFSGVPTILQFEDTPLLEVGKFVEAGYTTKFPVYHSDGTHIAVVKGSQIYPTKEGTAAKVTLRHEPNLTVCELEGKPILELHRTSPAAFKGWAELYAPEGVLIKAKDTETAALLRSDSIPLPGGGRVKNSDISGVRIGILFSRIDYVPKVFPIGMHCVAN